ncbi:MAG: hypothetical protein FGM41_07610 [Bacteroidetes bacterium]|nr:hypothetical protein [Bacteroidota bacterium]
MRIAFFYTLLLFSFVSSSGQMITSYSKADSLMDVGNFEFAEIAYKNQILETITNKGHFLDVYYYNLACNYALWGKNDSAFKYLNISLLMNQDFTFLYDLDLLNLRSDDRFELLKNNHKEYFLHKHQQLEYPYLAYELLRMKSADQSVRTIIDRVRYANRETELWNYQEVLDSMNLLQLKVILDSIGWPNEEKVGSLASETLWLIILHAPIQTILLYFDMIEYNGKNTNLGKRYYPFFKDRFEISQGREQIYGTQIDNSETCPKLYPVINPIELDKRRSEFGMEPIKSYLKRYKCK